MKAYFVPNFGLPLTFRVLYFPNVDSKGEKNYPNPFLGPKNSQVHKKQKNMHLYLFISNRQLRLNHQKRFGKQKTMLLSKKRNYRLHGLFKTGGVFDNSYFDNSF